MPLVQAVTPSRSGTGPARRAHGHLGHAQGHRPARPASPPLPSRCPPSLRPARGRAVQVGQIRRPRPAARVERPVQAHDQVAPADPRLANHDGMPPPTLSPAACTSADYRGPAPPSGVPGDPIIRAISAIGICFARRSRRISAQSSAFSTCSLPGSATAALWREVVFGCRANGQHSVSAELHQRFERI